MLNEAPFFQFIAHGLGFHFADLFSLQRLIEVSAKGQRMDLLAHPLEKRKV